MPGELGRRTLPAGAAPSGVLVVDKPAGITSHDVVAVARRALGERSIGHTGTLDPMATGVLALACGKATRLVRFLTASDKDYDAVIRFGVTTDTYDITGERTTETALRPTRTAVELALLALTGTYDQTPPPYSAKKVDGRRAYELARHQEPVRLKAVSVTVTRAALVSFDDDTAAVSLTCSAGFYVRAFAHELGRMVGTGACLESLRRTRTGAVTREQVVPLAWLSAPDARTSAPWAVALVDMASLLPDFPAVELTGDGVALVAHGRDLEPSLWQPSSRGRATTGAGGEWVRLFSDAGLVALATTDAATGHLHPAIVLLP